MATTATRRKRTTLAIDPVLLDAARRELGTESAVDTVEAALRKAVGKPRLALGASGKPPAARRIDEALAEEGFGMQ